MRDKKIGEILVQKGAITPEQLSLALESQKSEEGKIGEILMGQGLKRKDLHEAIADKFGLKFVDLHKSPIDIRLLDHSKREEYFNLQLIPWKQTEGKVKIAITELTPEIEAWAEDNYEDQEVEFVITSPNDILWALQEQFEKEDDELARLSVWQQNPRLCARKLIGPFRAAPLFVLLAVLFITAIYPTSSYIVVFTFANLIFFAGITFKNIMFLAGIRKPPQTLKIQVDKYPVYTVLVPVYKEEKILAQLIDGIKKLNYPKSKLDVKFVVEADDTLTINAIKALQPPAYMEIIRVPYSLPRTKPKACNYALRYARGEFVTIFDAEDIPHPNQLIVALSMFNAAPDLACVQARLNYYNYNDNQLTRWFALEYAVWFDAVMRGFARYHLPLPLGGTSNHVRIKILKEVGGWDAFNVTEDADLGMRLAHFGYRTKVIDSITMEEAPNLIKAWIKQRTRWIKGFIQTYFVHMRSPVQFFKKTGVLGFLGFQFFVGLPPLMYILAPILFAVGYYFYLPVFLFELSMFNLVYGAASHIFFTLAASEKLFGKKLVLSALTFPIYALLPIISAYRALWQLLIRPHYWDKTSHGLAKTKLSI